MKPMKNKITEADLHTQEFKAIASIIQHEVKLILEKYRYSLPISCQSVLAETLMELILENEDPAKCFDIAVVIMELRMKKGLREAEQLCEECKK